MAEETVITFAKDDTIIVEEAIASVGQKMQGGGWVRFERNQEAVWVQVAQVRYIRAARRAEGGR